MGSKWLWVPLFFLAAPVGAAALAVAMNRPMLFEPPGIKERLKIYLKYHTAETVENAAFPELRLRAYAIPRAHLIKAVIRSVDSLKRWKWVRREPELGLFQAVVTSPLWRFKDDVYILVSDLPTGKKQVYLYSASRVGRADFGANRRHILDLYEALEQELKKIFSAGNEILDPGGGNFAIIRPALNSYSSNPGGGQ